MAYKGKAWKHEWSFFINQHGRLEFNKICQRCIHECKQSFRATIIQCPKYKSKNSKK